MSVSGIQNSSYLAQLMQLSTITQNTGDGSGSNDGSTVSEVAQGSGGSLFSAIGQALLEAGISAPVGATLGSTDSSSTSDQNAQQALQGFMQNLFAALQAVGGQTGSNGNSPAASGVNTTSDPSSSVQGHHHHHHHHGGKGKLEALMEGLIQQLSGSDSNSTSSDSADTVSGSSSTSSSSADTALQQSFQNLFSTLGASDTQTSLPDFLQLIVQNMEGAGAEGNVVNTQA